MTPGAPASITVQDVSFSYTAADSADHLPALRGINHIFTPGSATLVTGMSGCGKSTLLRAVNGLIPHMTSGYLAGRVLVGGRDTTHSPLHDIGRHVATVFQNPRNQFFAATVVEELALARQQAGLPRGDIIAAVDDVADRLGIMPLLGRGLHSLSGGELQRVACAAALAGEASVVLLDEPTGNLSPEAIDDVTAVMRRMREDGRTLVVVEHRLHHLRGLVDHVLTMSDGRIDRVWSADEFYAQSETERTARGLRALRRPVLRTGLDATSPPGSSEGASPGQDRPGEVCAPVPARAPHAGPASHATGVEPDLLTAKAARPRPRAGIRRGAGSLGEPGLVAEDLTYAYGSTPVLDIGHVAFPRGQVTALLGPNGVGKSTLCRVLVGLVGAGRGRQVRWDGREVGRRERRAMSAVVMQDVHRQLFGETVRAEVGIGRSRCADPDAVLATLDLAGLADRHPMSLSGGQKQRLVIAAALVSEAELVVLDEPTSGVDLRHLEGIAGCAREMAARGCAVIAVSHDLEFINACADRVVRLEPGERGSHAITGGDHLRRAVSSM